MVSSEQIYAEVNGILNLLGEDYIRKLPIELYELIQNKKSKEINIKYKDINQIVEKNTSKEAISIIALFHLNYWCDTAEKDVINKLLKENFILNQAEARKKYDTSQLFKAKKINIGETKVDNYELVQVKGKSLFTRIIEKIKSFFK